ncbi:MAG: tail fiber domain-containing protein, partial [Bacteroidaceae bacterium]|nr:tail fiber domain-containing protein [Bacteroidaceae bacterium]
AYFFNGASYSNYPVIMSQTTHINGELFRGCYNTNTTLRICSDGSIFTATGVYTLSDGSHKNDIQTVDNALIALQEVKPVSYTLTIDSKNTGITTAQQVKRRTTNSDETANNDVALQESMTTDLTATIEAERKRPKYGFVAQEIEQILPNVVYTMPNGEKAIAYQEIIPLLVGAVKELNNHIDSLATRIEELENPATQQRQQAPAALQEAIADGSAALMQNTPNPFNQATEIAYRLPEGTATAMIMLCDMNGKMLQTYPLAVNTTAGTLTIQAGSYSPGMYLYTLLIDGVQIDTKQMIILAH